MSRSQSYCFLGITTICFFFCLLPLPNTFASPTRSLCRRDQRDALLELQKEFPNHSNDSFPVTTVSWNKSVDCCSWDGVTCDAILGNVISLELISRSSDTNTSLKSTSGLFKLQHLRHLLLPDCGLEGEIPSSIGNLSHLIKLDLSRNQLVGEVPASIGNLNQLESILLWDNHLRGNIPTSFANLTKLSQLIFSRNQFTGGEIVLANLTSLTFLDLSSNHFKSSIFSYLSELHNLETFLGNDNFFAGPFPSSLFMIFSLDRIELGKNQFDQGHIEFGNTSSSSKLETLVVSYNHLDGLIPESISKLVNLQVLDLSHNSFQEVPSSISRLVNLIYVDLSHNKLEGQVPPFPCFWSSSGLSQIKLSYNSFSSFSKSMEVIDGASVLELDLGSNSLKGPFPQWICKLSNLSVLDLSNNHFTGSIPQCLKGSQFEELNLKNNNFSGSLPDLFINGCQLVSLDVSGNSFVGQLPKSLNNCMYMEFFNVKGNKIKDTFPFWLGTLQDLSVLVLRSNLFYGSVYNPPVYVGFPRMRIIDISNNNFVGSLPQDYFANWTTMSTVFSYDSDIPSKNYMKSDFSAYRSVDMVYKGVDKDLDRIFLDLRVIDFSGNRFSGHIPKSIGLLSELRLLNLSGNTFTSYIPSSLEDNTKLETLDLSRNNLSGEIPLGLGKLSFVSNINFSYNHLEGLVPRSAQFGSQNCSSFLGNPGLYGLEEICGDMHNVHVPTSNQPDESLSEQEESVLNWIAAAIAFGPGVFCGLVIGYIFTSYKHEWFTAR